MNSHNTITIFYNLIEAAQFRAKNTPDKVAFIFLKDGETDELSYTYRELNERSKAIAAKLQNMELQGERVLLLYQPGLEFITAFMGCLYAGVVAVPVYPPVKETKIGKIVAIARDSGATLALTDEEIHDKIKKFSEKNPAFASFNLLNTEKISEKLASEWEEPNISEEDIAFIQYTSGSTGNPKGVMVSHKNLIHNEEIIKEACHHTSKKVFVGWLPLYHDMGLIGNTLQPVFLGMTCVMLSPVHFLQKPLRWLQAITKYGGTTSGGPNFAYDLCIKKITDEDKKNLDLSSWEIAFNGAEPIRASTLENFVKAFSSCGFKKEAFYPCYGMAEATLFISGGERLKPFKTLHIDTDALEANKVKLIDSEDAYQIVGCGHSFGGEILRIVHPETKITLKENEVGEIWVSGGSIAKGYWNNPVLSKNVFNAYTSDTKEGPFLRTGDLGFLHKEEVFVTGRLKDLIIIRGRNYYPQDIEHTVEKAHPGLRVGCCAAFSIENNGEEQLVVVQEVRREVLHDFSEKKEEIHDAIIQAVSEEHQLTLHDIVLIKTNTIPKTSSGKIQRKQCKVLYLDNKLENLDKLLEKPSNINSDVKNKIVVGASSDGHFIPTRKFSNIEKKESSEKADEIINWLREYAKFRINSLMIDERRSITPHIVLDFGNQGILGLQVPKHFEGCNISHRDFARIIIQLSAIDLTLTTFVSLQNILAINPILLHANNEIKEKWLPALAQGRELGALGFTEEGAGSNGMAISTTATPQPDGKWLINGKKIWIGNAAWAGVINVFAKYITSSGEHKGFVCFAIPQGTPGLIQGPEALTMGLKGMVQNSVYLDNVLIDDKYRLGEVGKGIEVMQDTVCFGRFYAGVSSVGVVKRALQLVNVYTSKRKVSTGLLRSNPITMSNFNKIIIALDALEATVWTLADALDAGEKVPSEISDMCKVFGPEFASESVDKLMHLLGGRGYIETNEMAQIYRDISIVKVFEGTTESLAMKIGATLLRNPQGIINFFQNVLYAQDIIEVLIEDSIEIKEYWEQRNKRLFDGFNRSHMAKFLIGELATFALLQACSRKYHNKTGQISYQHAVEWSVIKYKQKKKEALSAFFIDNLWKSEKDFGNIINNYTNTIGNIQKYCYGASYKQDDIIFEKDLKFDPENRNNGYSPIEQYEPASFEPSPIDIDVDHEIETNQEVADTKVEEIENLIKDKISEVLSLDKTQIKSDQNISAYGIDSINSVEITDKIAQELNIEVTPDLFWEYSSVNEIVNYLNTLLIESKKKVKT